MKYEYTFDLIRHDSLRQYLDEWEEDGWEVFSMAPDPGGGKHPVRADAYVWVAFRREDRGE